MNTNKHGSTKPPFKIASDTWLSSQSAIADIKQSIKNKTSEIQNKQVRLAVIAESIDAEIKSINESIDGLESLLYLQDKAQAFACQAMYEALAQALEGELS